MLFNKMNVGITGSKGFLGNYVSALLKKNENVSSVDGFDLPESDIFDQDALKNFVEGKDAIIHLAALNRAEDSELMRVNVEGTKSLANSVKENNPRCRLVFASSFQVYGKSTNEDIIEENFPKDPLSVYGKSKLAGEKIIADTLQSYAVLRISNIYGPGCKPFYNAVTATFAHLAKEGKPINITGSGEQSRDFIHVEDVAEGIVAATLSKESGIFNLCTGESISLDEMTDILKKDFPDLQVTHQDSDAEILGTKGSFKKARAAFGWEPKKNFQEGFPDCWK